MLNSILLVDDDKVTNYLNERIVRKLGITNELKTASNGQEAINYLIARSAEGRSYPDLLLVDINMPIMDGFEFLEIFNSIASDGESVKVVMLTTSADNNDLEKAKHYKVDGYFNKPLTEEKLKAILEEHFSKVI